MRMLFNTEVHHVSGGDNPGMGPYDAPTGPPPDKPLQPVGLTAGMGWAVSIVVLAADYVAKLVRK